MTTIAVTAASGQLGRLVVDALLQRGVAPASIVAAVRTPTAVEDLAARGVQVREADYTKPETLKAAFEGVDRVLLISSSAVGQRAAQHENAIVAAEEAGVELLAYTSVLQADTTTMQLAAEHQATERRLADATVPVALLRNGWYVENYTDQLAVALEHGVAGSAGDGRLSPATRRDFAEAAAAVLTGDGHEGATYELGGDEAVTMAEIAALIGQATGRDVAYVDLPVEAYTEVLSNAGLPAPIDAIIADSSAAVGRGELRTDSGDLSRLIGRPTTPVAEGIRAGVAAAGPVAS
jgi:NAD(P)H dehydrogenase (quinone)